MTTRSAQQNAPDVIHAVAAAGVEGENPVPSRKKESVMDSSAHNPRDTAVGTMSVARWTELAGQENAVDASERDPLATPCPAWCSIAADPDEHHLVTPHHDDRAHVSDRRMVALSTHAAIGVSSAGFIPAAAEVEVWQRYICTDPMIVLSKREQQRGNAGGSTVDRSPFSLTLEEAAELGRVLLDAVDVAMGLAEESQ